MDDLKPNDQKFVKTYITNGHNAVQAAQKAYGLEYASAGVKGSRLIKRDKIQKAIKSIAEQISDVKLVKVLNQGLDATKDGEEDYGVRHKYLDTALKLKGLYEDDAQKKVNIIMPILVKFIDAADNRDTKGIQETL